MMKSIIAVALIVLLSSVIQGEAQLYPIETIYCLNACPNVAMLYPVCGSNGVTYPNPVKLRCTAKCLGQDIKILYYGECEK